MSSVLVGVLSNVVIFLLKMLADWGAKSIAAQKELHRKMEEQKERIENARKKAEAYEQNPTDSSRNDIP